RNRQDWRGVQRSSTSAHLSNTTRLRGGEAAAYPTQTRKEATRPRCAAISIKPSRRRLESRFRLRTRKECCMGKFLKLASLLVIATLVLAACGGTPAAAPTAAPAPTAAARAAW